MKRTHLPLNALRVFDAAARHLSFTRAADELAVTPAAVGQQIRALEDVLGVVLFRRTPKGLELTEEAGAGLEGLRGGFLQFEGAVQAMQAGQASHVYTLAAPRDLFAVWLAPRLAAFRAAHPEVRFTLLDEAHADFTEANLDLALRWCEGPGDFEGVQLAPAEQAEVGSGDWIAWPGATAPTASASTPDGSEPAITLGDAGQALAAAAAGLGRTVVPALLAQSWLAAGRIATIGPAAPARRAYWLLAPAPQWRQKKVRELVAFFTAN